MILNLVLFELPEIYLTVLVMVFYFTVLSFSNLYKQLTPYNSILILANCVTYRLSLVIMRSVLPLNVAMQKRMVVTYVIDVYES